ncbi:hypothetical protein SO802_033391 [Lithocarpus litseifolius]|uniref:CCHC-type domain-containing protein n=1 Tax=Lithocarpus litseifolius TaxID=425828 RepID=A0AAW2BCS6_9ROSI
MGVWHLWLQRNAFVFKSGTIDVKTAEKCPVFSLEKRRLSLHEVIKRVVGYHFLQAKLLALWKPAGKLDFIDLGRDFYLIRFGLKEDYSAVLEKGPWFVGEHFLSIRPWESNFKPSLASVTSIAVWVRFLELPIEYYDMEILKKIWKSVGHVLRIDTHTATETRGRYAGLCIQVDINKPLITSIVLGGREQPICYEGIQRLCFACGRIGHRREVCPYVVRASSSPERVDTAKKNACMEHDLVVPRSGEGDTLHEDTSGTVSDDLYGTWLVVTRRRSANKSPKKGLGVDSYK